MLAWGTTRPDGERITVCIVWNPLRVARVDGAGGVSDMPRTGAITIQLRFRDPVGGSVRSIVIESLRLESTAGMTTILIV